MSVGATYEFFFLTLIHTALQYVARRSSFLTSCTGCWKNTSVACDPRCSRLSLRTVQGEWCKQKCDVCVFLVLYGVLQQGCVCRWIHIGFVLTAPKVEAERAKLLALILLQHPVRSKLWRRSAARLRTKLSRNLCQGEKFSRCLVRAHQFRQRSYLWSGEKKRKSVRSQIFSFSSSFPLHCSRLDAICGKKKTEKKEKLFSHWRLLLPSLFVLILQRLSGILDIFFVLLPFSSSRDNSALDDQSLCGATKSFLRQHCWRRLWGWWLADWQAGRLAGSPPARQSDRKQEIRGHSSCSLMGNAVISHEKYASVGKRRKKSLGSFGKHSQAWAGSWRKKCTMAGRILPSRDCVFRWIANFPFSSDHWTQEVLVFHLSWHISDNFLCHCVAGSASSRSWMSMPFLPRIYSPGDFRHLDFSCPITLLAPRTGLKCES